MKLNRQGVRVLDDDRQRNGRRERQHQFETRYRAVADEHVAGLIHEERFKQCIHCDYTLDSYEREENAHLRVPCAPHPRS